MVGHTHDDVDQMFSRFSLGLASVTKILSSLDEMMELFRKSYTPSPRVVKLEYLQDWKSYFDLFSLSGTRVTKMQLHGHLRPLQFWFTSLNSSPEGRAQMRFKKLSSDEKWRPVNDDTAPIVFFKGKVLPLAHLEPLPLKPVDENLYKEVLSTFKVASRFGMSNDQKEYFPLMLSTWSGYEFHDGILVNVGSTIELKRVADIPILKRWAEKKQVDGQVMYIPNTCGIHDSDSSDGGINEDDVSTDDDEIVYRGNLHSSKTSKYKTNKSNFIDPKAVVVGQLILVRVENSKSVLGIELCKVLSFVDGDPDHIHIHWYGGKYTGIQKPLFKKRNTKNKRAPKNVAYVDNVHVQTILTNEEFSLNASNKIPAHIRRIAQQRLSTVSRLEIGSSSSSSAQ